VSVNEPAETVVLLKGGQPFEEARSTGRQRR
jgi:hypothetical protein